MAFVRGFALRCGLLVRRSGRGRFGPAGGAQATRRIGMCDCRRRGGERVLVRLARGRREGNELAQAHAGWQQCLNTDQDRRDESNHTNPRTPATSSRVLYFRVLFTSIPIDPSRRAAPGRSSGAAHPPNCVRVHRSRTAPLGLRPGEVACPPAAQQSRRLDTPHAANTTGIARGDTRTRPLRENRLSCTSEKLKHSVAENCDDL